MIVPGRRALGEDWSEVHIIPDSDTGEYRVERKDAPAPEDRTAIFVPGLGNMSMEVVDYALGWQREKAKARAKQPKRNIANEVNNMWQDYMQEKLQWFRGRSVSGPGGWTQREKVNRG